MGKGTLLFYQLFQFLRAPKFLRRCSLETIALVWCCQPFVKRERLWGQAHTGHIQYLVGQKGTVQGQTPPIYLKPIPSELTMVNKVLEPAWKCS